MAFLRKLGCTSRNLPFAVIYSGLQKGLRGNLLELVTEMAREFRDYPNALKKRLIQNVAEDCCDWELMMRIYNCEPNFDRLLNFVPEICSHVKCRDATFGFRVAIEFPDAMVSGKILRPTFHDSMLELLIKEKTALRYGKIDAFGVLMEQLINQKWRFQIQFHKVYMFCSKNRSIVDSTIAYLTRDYTHEKPVDVPKLPPPNLNLVLPQFIFDKHTGNYAVNKNYDFFLNNMIIAPRKEPTYLEKLARHLYLTGTKRTKELLSINPNSDPKVIDKKTEQPF